MSDSFLSLATLRTLTPTQAAVRWALQEERDEALFEQWIGASEDNRTAWQNARRVWGLFDDAEQDPMIAAMARAARQAGPEPTDDHDAFIVPEAANDRGWAKAMVAAIAIFLVATTAFLGVQNRWFGVAGPPTTIASVAQSDPLTRFGEADYVTGKGEKSVVDLPDGTRVTLAPDSALDLAFKDRQRDLRLLRGRGYFDVAHDSAHPFAVEAGGRVVTALGTRFDIDLKASVLRVVLAQGSVSVASAPGSAAARMDAVLLQPGQAFSATGAKPGTVTNADVDQELSWRDGFAAFDNKPLSEIVETLNRSTRAQMFIHDPKVAAMRVTGQFRTGDIERFGRELRLVLRVRIVARGPDRYEIVASH